MLICWYIFRGISYITYCPPLKADVELKGLVLLQASGEFPPVGAQLPTKVEKHLHLILIQLINTIF